MIERLTHVDLGTGCILIGLVLLSIALATIADTLQTQVIGKN